MVPVGADAAAELAASMAAGPPPQAQPDTSRLNAVLRDVAERLEHGRGFCLLRGLNLDRLDDPEAALLALGRQLGTPLPQDAAGTLVGRLAGPGSTADAPARFHADPADAVALLCLQQPREGGTVSLVSAPALHNLLMKSDRAALAVLHREWPHGSPDAPVMLPVLSTAGGTFAGRYGREAMVESALDPAQLAALEALAAAAAAPGQARSIALHTGDLLFHNPQLVWKQVNAGPDAAPEAASRQLLRLWLEMPGSLGMPENFRQVFHAAAGSAPAGMVGG